MSVTSLSRPSQSLINAAFGKRILCIYACLTLFFIACINHKNVFRHPLFFADEVCLANGDANYLFISIKSTSRYHSTRLPLILNTWVRLALNLRTADGENVVQKASYDLRMQVVIVTDGEFSTTDNPTISPNSSELDYSEIGNDTGPFFYPSQIRHPIFLNAGHCGSSHQGESLACKMLLEFRAYFSHDGSELASWFCHFDDDTYVNVINMLNNLKRIGNPREVSYFVGKIPLPVKEGMEEYHVVSGANNPRVIRWLHGQAICISQKLMSRIRPVLSDSHPYNFMKISQRNDGLADDVVLSMLINERLKVSSTVVEEMYTPFDVTNLTWNAIARAVTLPLPLDKTTFYDRGGAVEESAPPDFDEMSRLTTLHSRLLEISNLSCIQAIS